MRWRVARPVVESVKIGDDERRQNQAMKLVNSGCSGEDNVVEGGLCRSKGITRPCQKDCGDREKSEPKRIRLGTAHRRRKLAMNCSF